MIIGIPPRGADKRTHRKLISNMLRAAGCNCRPHIGLPKRGDDGLHHITISHDDWCHLLQRREARFN